MSSNGKANAALAAAVIFLLLSTCSAYFAFDRLSTSEGWVRHTHDVQSSLAQFTMSTARAGRLRAEYVDSGDPSLVQRQTDEVNQIRNTVASIQRLTADNAEEQANCKTLADLTEKRIAIMDDAIQLKRSGRSTLLGQAEIMRQLVSVGEDTDLLLQRMYDAENQLLAQRQARVQRSSSLTVAVLVASLFLALILFVVHHRMLVDQVTACARAESQQRALSAKLLTLQDEERRKFARELHDSVGQHLAALKMALSLVQPKLPEDKILQDCFKLLDDSIAETRTISHLLHPPLLDEAGLNSASRWFVEGFGQRSGIAVNLDIRDGDARLPPPVELVLFRALQESLTNVHRHSGAKHAEVSLRTTGNRVVLRVKDDGHGMPAAALRSIRENGVGTGVGLAGMTERIREIGGRLEVNSSPAGTEIVARVPVRSKAALEDRSPAAFEDGNEPAAES
jgi:signal transduction histidine kinase